MTDDRLPQVPRPYAGMRTPASSATTPANLASVISNPRWSARIVAAADNDELVREAWQVFRAALHQCRRGPDVREAARITAAETLIRLAEDLHR